MKPYDRPRFDAASAQRELEDVIEIIDRGLPPGLNMDALKIALEDIRLVVAVNAVNRYSLL